MEAKIKETLENYKGKYVSRLYYETFEDVQKRMDEDDYFYFSVNANNILNFVTKKEIFSIPLKEFDWKILWDKLGNIPVNEDEEIEEPFEHFEVGTHREEIWSWFEWFFDISIGETFFSSK